MKSKKKDSNVRMVSKVQKTIYLGYSKIADISNVYDTQFCLYSL